MISRRTVLPTLAGGIALQYLPAHPTVCGGGAAYDYQDLEKISLKSWKTYRFHEKECPNRPLWSKLSKDEQKTLSDKIRRGYTALIQRSLRRPTDLGGLIGQAWIHHHACSGGGNIHQNSAFLPWHRAFLYFHERWLQTELRDRTFRLPVWDWENDSTVPKIFDGWLNIPKYDGARLECTYLANSAVDPIDSATLKAWLLSHAFIDFTGGANHAPNAAGAVHGNVHTCLGGLMKDTDTSALHPIFYMHHANVDRFWAAWWEDYQIYDGFAPEWVKGPMSFADPHHGIVKVYPEQVAELTHLGYKYIRPKDKFFQFTNICAVSKGNTVSMNPNAFLELFRRIAGLLQQPLSGKFQGETFPVDPSAELAALLGVILDKLPDLTLPVRMILRVPSIRAGICYPLFLDSERIGNVSFFGPQAHMHDVFAVGSLRLAGMPSLLRRAMHPGIQVSLEAAADMGPAKHKIEVLAFDVAQPLSQENDQNVMKFFGISH